MMRVEEFDLDAPEAWLEELEACGGNALHMPATHLPSVERSELRLLRIQAGGGGRACALAILPARKGLRRVLGGGSRALVLPTAPAVEQGGDARAMLQALAGYAREQGCDRLVVQAPYSSHLTGDESLTRFRTASICEFILPLDAAEEAIASAYHKTHRKNVRRSVRAGLQLREENGIEGLLALREMQLSSSQRASEKAEGFGVPDEGYFHRLHEHLYRPGHGRLIFADLEGEPVAALAWIAAAGRAQTVRSGSSAKGYETRAMYFLYDELIRRCVREGGIELNCGGVPLEAAAREHPQHGLYEFKEGFGGLCVPRHGLDIPLREIES